ncbi:hypothetical protein RhiXN_07854 [Rhizoctonia solani]|uniref:Uncharacterized protein n=1 Tax=Rhizoctonia solani TaxID=456999 RepID=A0A8H8P1I2_9AGAM|nr:uncharacterized protein RhiXN_07854 [Rhizoctonia solani]QRW22818.1 hypothetical protein RhiXN_07854 [Rhizoctonia solani]
MSRSVRAPSEEETELWDKLKGYVKANSNPPELPSLPSNQELRKIGASDVAVELARRLFQAENRIVESEKLCQTPLAHYQLQDTFINNNHLRGTTQTAGCVGGEKQEAEKCGEDDHRGQGVIGATSSRLSGINSSDLGWQSRASTTSYFTTPCLPSTSGGRWVPPGRRFIAAEPFIPNVILGARPSVTTSTAGGWRAREAARIATMTAASRSSDSHSTMPQHTQ